MITLQNPADFHLVQAYLDRQLPPPERLAFEARLMHEPALAQAITGEQWFRAGLRLRLRPPLAPSPLSEYIQQNMPIAGPPPPEKWWRRWAAWWVVPRLIQPYAAAASLIIVGLLAVAIVQLGTTATPLREGGVFYELAGQHTVYLAKAPVPLDIRGDSSAVSAWFTGRVPFSVFSPTSTEWQLEGARLTELHGQGAAQLVYDRQGVHLSLTVFVPHPTDFPAETRQQLGDDDFFSKQANALTVMVWQSDQLGYALVGDPAVSAAELQTVALDFQRQLELK